VWRPDVNAQIASESYRAMQRLGAEPELVAMIIGRWRDTLVDILCMLRIPTPDRPGRCPFTGARGPVGSRFAAPLPLQSTVNCFRVILV
jgi:hypothetical protein